MLFRSVVAQHVCIQSKCSLVCRFVGLLSLSVIIGVEEVARRSHDLISFGVFSCV